MARKGDWSGESGSGCDLPQPVRRAPTTHKHPKTPDVNSHPGPADRDANGDADPNSDGHAAPAVRDTNPYADQYSDCYGDGY